MRISESQLRKIVRDQLLTEVRAFPFLLFWGSMKGHDDIEEVLSSKAFFDHLFQSSMTLLGVAYVGTRTGAAVFSADLTAAIAEYKEDQTILSALFVGLGIVPLSYGIFKKGKEGGKSLAQALKKAGINDKKSLIAAVKNSGKGRSKLTSDMIEAWELIDKINRRRGGRPLFPGGIDKILKTGRQSPGRGVPQPSGGKSAKVPQKPKPQNQKGPTNFLQGFEPTRN